MALPRIDVPIAYAWCETRVPADMKVGRWGGALRHVERFSSETAVAQMAYGRAELAKGYDATARPLPGPLVPLVGPSGRGVPVRPSPGATWVDLDSDGQFDAKYHYETSKGMAIWLDDEWIKATSPEGLANGAILEDGRTVRFDPSKGEWVLTASKGGLPSSME